MRLLTFYTAQGLHLGVKTERGVLDATLALGVTAENFITDPAVRRHVHAWAETGESVALDECALHLAPCVPRPGKIIGVGLNYREYMKKQNAALPEFPYLFPKFGEAARGSGECVEIPAGTQQADFEAELAVVIGAHTRRVREENALEHVLGYCCANDLTARDFQNATPSWMPGKCCDGFAPLGPYLVTADEVVDPNCLRVRGWVNDDLRQDFNTADMIRSVPFLISGISRYFSLEPGDVILTGTSVGHIMLDPPEARVWLRPGDLLEVEVEGLGRLKTPLIAERSE